ncbi:hypothetical protein GCM10025866_28940 [Naasia aerilata]|uniref:Methionyl-tRNA formyltransferase n=1 Tax=Naasia aerilata TaxID=1162966 RepID=A0ABN6XTK0_9MICO|nr:hypothetical protein GCM10025866_28940 [Naasia aerilata]
MLAARRAPAAERPEPGRLILSGGKVLLGTGDDPIELVRVQAAGGRALEAAAWWRGLRTDALDAALPPTQDVRA